VWGGEGGRGREKRKKYIGACFEEREREKWIMLMLLIECLKVL
jgi:hypothetical protein